MIMLDFLPLRILLLAAAQTLLFQTATSTSIASSSENTQRVQYHTRSERSKSQKPVPASRERNYVKKLLSKLELEPTQQNIQRAKFAYEEEARRHTRELHRQWGKNGGEMIKIRKKNK